MFKKRRFYTLFDIRKQLTFLPLLFVGIGAILSLILIIFVLEFRKNNEISFHLQKDKFYKKTILNEYISDLKFNASSSFDKEEVDLKDSIISLLGYIKYSEEKITLEKLKILIAQIKKKSNLDFVIFDKESFEIYYGKQSIDYLKTITNSNLELNNFRYHMLRNILYIGDDNLIYWIDNDKRKIRLSYFKNVENSKFYLGAFTKVDDMKDSVRNAVLTSIVQKRS